MLFLCNAAQVGQDEPTTMASTIQHSLMEQMRVDQAVTTANLVKASQALAAIESLNMRVRRHHVEFGLEDELKNAMQTELQAAGYINVEALEFFKAIKDLDGKDEYCFDGVVEATKSEQQYLCVGHTQQSLVAQDVRDAEADRQKLLQRLLDVRTNQSKEGARSYNSQTRQLEEYKDFTVLLYVGGSRVLPSAMKEAKEVKCALLQPSEGRMQMTFLNDVSS